MATATDTIPQQKKVLLYKDNEFEKEVKTRLTWTRSKWAEVGDTQQRWKKLVNSMKYWEKQLASAQFRNNVILTVFSEDKNVFLSMQRIFDAIYEIDESIQIKGYSTFRNPRYLSVTFQTEEIRDFIKNSLRYVDGVNVAYLDWAGGSLSHSIKIHWLSDEIDIKYPKNFMEQYFDITEEKREELVLMSGKKIPSGTVSFTGILKKEKDINLVPHITNIKGLQCLINIRGRECLCLSCDLLGHKANACPTPYCTKCLRLKPKIHKCVDSENKEVSYADKVRKNGEALDDGELKTWNPGVIITGEQDMEDLMQTEHNKEEEKKNINDKNSDHESTSSEQDSYIDLEKSQQMLATFENYLTKINDGEVIKPAESRQNSDTKKQLENNPKEEKKNLTSIKRKNESTPDEQWEKASGTGSWKTYGRNNTKKSPLNARDKEKKRWDKLMASNNN